MHTSVFNWSNINSYQEAKAKYEATTPRKFKLAHRFEHYGEDCRPLGSRGHFWKYITKGEEGGVVFYDCVFYSTKMLRYYEDGRIVVCPEGIPSHYHTISSSGFLHATLPDNYYSWREMGKVFVIYQKEKLKRDDYLTIEDKGGVEVKVFNYKAYCADLWKVQTKALIGETSGVELNIADGGFRDAQKIYHLKLNRGVTKLLRAQNAEVLEQAWALASIADGCTIQPKPLNENNTALWTHDPMGVFAWMQNQFSAWRGQGNGYRFCTPTKSEFNKVYLPIMYYIYEQNRDVNNDPSVFDVVELKPKTTQLRTSKRWYALHKDDPRHETHPNIF